MLSADDSQTYIFKPNLTFNIQIWIPIWLCNNLYLDVSKTPQTQQAHCRSPQPGPPFFLLWASWDSDIFSPPHPPNQRFTKSYQFYFPGSFLIHLRALCHSLAKLLQRPPDETPHFCSCLQLPLHLPQVERCQPVELRSLYLPAETPFVAFCSFQNGDQNPWSGQQGPAGSGPPYCCTLHWHELWVLLCGRPPPATGSLHVLFPLLATVTPPPYQASDLSPGHFLREIFPDCSLPQLDLDPSALSSKG